MSIRRAYKRQTQWRANDIIEQWKKLDAVELNGRYLAQALGVDWDTLGWDLDYKVENMKFCTHSYLDKSASKLCAQRATSPIDTKGYAKAGFHVTDRTMLSVAILATVRTVPPNNIVAHLHSAGVHQRFYEQGLVDEPLKGWIWPLVTGNPDTDQNTREVTETGCSQIIIPGAFKMP